MEATESRATVINKVTARLAFGLPPVPLFPTPKSPRSEPRPLSTICGSMQYGT